MVWLDAGQRGTTCVAASARPGDAASRLERTLLFQRLPVQCGRVHGSAHSATVVEHGEGKLLHVFLHD